MKKTSSQSQQCKIHSFGHEDVLFRTDIITRYKLYANTERPDAITHCTVKYAIYMYTRSVSVDLPWPACLCTYECVCVCACELRWKIH